MHFLSNSGFRRNPAVNDLDLIQSVKKCNQCGKCCINYSDGGLSASAGEIALWDQFRPDIARYVDNGRIWVNPDTGQQLKRCPWLRQLPGQAKYICDIYEDRPDDCKFYPVSIEQMLNDECEMLEAHDLDNPRQAQETLNKIMADSRPPFKSWMFNKYLEIRLKRLIGRLIDESSNCLGQK